MKWLLKIVLCRRLLNYASSIIAETQDLDQIMLALWTSRGRSNVLGHKAVQQINLFLFVVSANSEQTTCCEFVWHLFSASESALGFELRYDIPRQVFGQCLLCRFVTQTLTSRAISAPQHHACSSERGPSMVTLHFLLAPCLFWCGYHSSINLLLAMVIIQACQCRKRKIISAKDSVSESSHISTFAPHIDQ